MKKITTFMIASTLLAGCSSTQQPELSLEQQVDQLYARMTPEERIAQLRSGYMEPLFNEAGELDTAACAKLIPNGIGHFSQYASQAPTDPNILRDRVAAVQDWLMHNTPSGIPALFHEEVLSGINTSESTIYPQQIGQACSFNPELAELKTLQTGLAMRKMGGVLSLSPMVDVCRDPSFNRLEESYGEDGYLSAVMGTAFVRGLQQGDLKKGVGACSKHYLGYGGGGDAEEREMMEEIILPHETMIRLAGSKALMPGYHAVHGTNCVANDEILIDILRGYLGFDGMVVSDYTAIDQIPDIKNPLDKAIAAIKGGNDVDFPHGANYQYLQTALDEGLLEPEVFERAVKDVLRYKFRAGLMDEHPYLYSEEHIELDTPKERQTAYDIASQSVVLLQNKGVLPLKQQRVLVTGPNANTMWAMCGDYSFPCMTYFWKMYDKDLDHPHTVTLLEGLQNRKPEGYELQYSRGCDWTEEIETIFNTGVGDERAWDYMILHRKVDSGEKADKAEALRMAKDCDVIVAAMGENVMLCGENRNRQGLSLPGQQEQYVESLLATGKPVVLVLFGGRAQVISKIADRCAAVIQAWYPGEEGGNAVADILYGKVNPSAKLSVSYPNQEVYGPLCYTYAEQQDPRVQWPFGYGLSYTTFEYGKAQAPAAIKTTDEAFEVSFEVKNTGDVAGTEIAQIYITNEKHPMLLQGFARVELQPGETKTVTCKLYTEQLGFFSHENGVRQWNIEPGTTTLKIAASSQDVRQSLNLQLEGETFSKPIREFYFSESSVK